MNINPNDSATGYAPDGYSNTGLTIRAQIAAMAMQGLLSKPGLNNIGSVANEAVACADSLIRKLNETS